MSDLTEATNPVDEALCVRIGRYIVKNRGRINTKIIAQDFPEADKKEVTEVIESVVWSDMNWPKTFWSCVGYTLAMTEFSNPNDLGPVDYTIYCRVEHTVNNTPTLLPHDMESIHQIFPELNEEEITDIVVDQSTYGSAGNSVGVSISSGSVRPTQAKKVVRDMVRNSRAQRRRRSSR